MTVRVRAVSTAVAVGVLAPAGGLVPAVAAPAGGTSPAVTSTRQGGYRVTLDGATTHQVTARVQVPRAGCTPGRTGGVRLAVSVSGEASEDGDDTVAEAGVSLTCSDGRVSVVASASVTGPKPGTGFGRFVAIGDVLTLTASSDATGSRAAVSLAGAEIVRSAGDPIAVGYAVVGGSADRLGGPADGPRVTTTVWRGATVDGATLAAAGAVAVTQVAADGTPLAVPGPLSAAGAGFTLDLPRA